MALFTGCMHRLTMSAKGGSAGATPLAENITDRNSTQWDRIRELDIGVQNRPQQERQEDVIRMLAPEIPKYICVKEWLPYFQKRGKLFSEEEEQELLLEQTRNGQGNRLSTLLVKLSQGSRPFLAPLLLSLRDSYEAFIGGKSTHDHWTFMEMLLDAVHSVDGLPPYQLPSVSEVLPKLCGVEFTQGTAMAFADALGVDPGQFTSCRSVVESWLRKSKNCSFIVLVQALFRTHGLGKLVTGLYSACRSNPPIVFNWFKNLSTEDLRRVASFVGLSAEMECIEAKYCNDKKSIPQIFLRYLRIPDCGDALRDMLDSLGKATKVKKELLTCVQRTPTTVHHKEQTNAKDARVDKVLTILELVLKEPSDPQTLPSPVVYPDESDDSLSPFPSGSGNLESSVNHRDTSPEPKSKAESTGMQIHEDQPEDKPMVQGKELLEACRAKEWEIAQTLLQSQGPGDTFVELCDEASGKTALHYACEDGRLELAELLMKLGADITKLNKAGLSVLNYPRVFRSEDILRRILAAFREKGCSVDTAGNANRHLTPLMLVCYDGDALYASAQLLLDSGASPQGNKKSFSCPLIAACEGGHRRLVELLLAKGAPLDSQDRSGSTALLQACRQRHLEIASILLEQPSINVNLSDKSGSTPLFEVVASNNVPLARCLLELKARVNITREISNEIMTGSIEETPLAHACARGFEELVELLIDNGANLNYKCAGTVPPIGFAIIGHQNHIIERLLKCNALSTSIDDMSTPIISAVRVENYECAKKLIDRLGGTESAFRQASERGHDLLATHIKMFESVADSSFATTPDLYKQMNTGTQKQSTHGGISKAEKDATLDRFCHLCVLILREYEIKGNYTSLQDLSSIAQALHPDSPNIPEFLSRIANYQVNSDLQRLLLHGFPSALTFLIEQKILTKDGFVVQALKYYDNNPEDFYQKLVYSFQSIQHGENLPKDIDSVLNHLFTHQFQINIKVSGPFTGDGGFPSNDMLPEEFRVRDTPPNFTQMRMLNLDTGNGPFPPNEKLPKEFQVQSAPVHPSIHDGDPLLDEAVPDSERHNMSHDKGLNNLSMEEQKAPVTEGHDLSDVDDNLNTSQPCPTVDSLRENPLQNNAGSNQCPPVEVASPTHPTTKTRRSSLQKQEQCRSSDSTGLLDIGPETPESERESQSLRSWTTHTNGSTFHEHNLNRDRVHDEVVDTNGQKTLSGLHPKGTNGSTLIEHEASQSGVASTNRQMTLNGLHPEEVKQERSQSSSMCSVQEKPKPTKSGKKHSKRPPNNMVRQTTTSLARQQCVRLTTASSPRSHSIQVQRTMANKLTSHSRHLHRNQSEPARESPIHPPLSRQQQKPASLDQTDHFTVFDAGMCLADAPTDALLTAVCHIQFEQSQYQYTRYTIKVLLGAETVWKDDTFYKAGIDEENIRKGVAYVFNSIRRIHSYVDSSTLIDVEITAFCFL